MQSSPNSPVLLIIFNRPDLARRVFDRIRQSRPSQLFVAADGPRHDHPDDNRNCQETRQIITLIDWPCEVKTLFQEKNLGCRSAVGSAITWFFEHVEAGIILEDDCVPDLSFFPFCGELLARYKNDDQVMSISGDCFQTEGFESGVSYSFTLYQHVWGWATWRRAWRHYDPNLSNKDCLFNPDWLRDLLLSEDTARFWCDIIHRYDQGLIDTWDYPWTFSCWVNHGLSIIPAVNLVTNIGFDPRATHTKESETPFSKCLAATMSFPLRHPPEVQRNETIDIALGKRFQSTATPANKKPPSRIVRTVTLIRKLLSLG